MSDLIERQAAIDALHMHLMYRMGTDSNKKRLDDWINSLPSAQPEKRTEKRTETHACDLISRQAAIEAIKEDKIDLTNPNVVAVFKATGDFEKVETQVMTCDRHIEILKDLPSAQPERKRGKWIDYTDEGYVECPFCHSATNCDGNEDELHFCFSCGADMREDDHEAR